LENKWKQSWPVVGSMTSVSNNRRKHKQTAIRTARLRAEILTRDFINTNLENYPLVRDSMLLP